MLILTLALFAVLWFVVLGFANASVNSLRQSREQVSGEQAYWAAEAGLRLALQALAKDATYSPKEAWVSMAHLTKTRYRIEVYPSKTSPVKIPSDCIYVLVTGKESAGLERQMAAVVKPATGKKSLLNFSVFANSLLVDGGSRIDSFDSTVGPSVRGSLANVATNSIVAGAINLTGGSWIQGTIQVGVGGKTGLAKPSTPTKGSANVVWKDWSCWSLAESAMTSALSFPAVASPAAGTADVKVDYKGLTLSPGSYRDLAASGGGEVRLGGGTYVFRSLKLTGGAKLSFTGTASNPAIVYCTKDLDLTGGTLSNTSAQPRNLTFMLAKDVAAKMNGGAQAFAVVYGPQADFVLQGGTDLYGAIVGRKVEVKNGASIHYDVDLIKNPPAGLTASGSSTEGTTVVSLQRL